MEKPSIPQLLEQFALIQLLSSVFDTELEKGMNIDYKQEKNQRKRRREEVHHHHPQIVIIMIQQQLIHP